MKGKVIRYIQNKNIGFIRGDDGHDYFFHKSELPNSSRTGLEQGQTVEFISSSNERGLLALRIKPFQFVNYSTETQVNTLKRNPFTPQDPVYDPRKFAGRSVSVINAIDSLFNGKNVLVSGHRGVGKSSLAIQLLNVLKGNDELLKKLNFNTGDFRFNYLTSDHRCTEGNTIEEISTSLVNGLASSLGYFEKSSNSSSEWQVSLKFLRYKEKTEKDKLMFSDVSTQFASDLSKLRKVANSHSYNGICMLTRIQIISAPLMVKR